MSSINIRWKLTLALLSLLAALLWLGVTAFPDQNLHIVACDVGQGDAILAFYGSTQILVDGGPNNKVLDCLSKFMPFWDRKIELVLLTHPQKDHYGGLIDVLRAYDVETFIATPLDSSSPDFKVLKDQVGGKGIAVHNHQSGQTIRLGLIHLDILWPSEEFLAENSSNNIATQQSDHSSGVLGAFSSKLDPNQFSTVTILRFKNFDALLTGDIDPAITEDILATGKVSDVEYLKVPHHGSKNGLTQKLLEAVNPEVAVVSSGKNNPYGHPHKEVLDLLESSGSRILRTDQDRNIEIVTDGQKWWLVE